MAKHSPGTTVTSEKLDTLLPDRWLEQNPKHVWTIDEVHRKERRRTQKLRRQRHSKR
ncbi:MAG: hypothetical protein AAF483_13280 [Planctomycetota bacterium]